MEALWQDTHISNPTFEPVFQGLSLSCFVIFWSISGSCSSCLWASHILLIFIILFDLFRVLLLLRSILSNLGNIGILGILSILILVKFIVLLILLVQVLDLLELLLAIESIKSIINLNDIMLVLVRICMICSICITTACGNHHTSSADCASYTACAHASSSSLLETSFHTLDEALIFHLIDKVLIMGLFGNDSLLIEKAFRKCMVLALNSFGFLFPNNQVKTCWTHWSSERLSHRTPWFLSSRLSSCFRYTWPLSVWNLYEFAQKYLILTRDFNVFFRVEEVGSLLLLVFVSLDLALHYSSVRLLGHTISIGPWW